MMRPTWRFLFAVCLASPALAANLELRYGALERLIAEQLFTEDGRRYVKGDAKAHCQYAYLEAPHLSSNTPDGRLKITAKFSGRSAMNVFGKCMGLGDSFDLTILAAPVVRKGAIAMDNVQVTTVKDSYYIRRVREGVRQSFAKDFTIDVRDQARKLLEQPRPNASFQQELADFSLNAIRASGDSLVLEVEFKLVVK
ncbi:MAG TPA: hypothetical protein VGN17_18875 [Bryobacteraceae bacterium]|jgi:hypothetical protein